ncbi:LOW QUALITY PROTEIN: hypothetical protein U9M48_031166 [Paspalum notatum var. saurae]|uniref:Integrase catalytic domain-containing protein n=1 Tax=Paspalum notatum var. saurae TaxID=547442 RepID=A0AAQ3X329_PASNO
MSTSRPLELLHMDLFGPTTYTSIGRNNYGFVIVDNFSIYTWVYFLENKTEVAHVFSKFVKRAQNEFNTSIVKIRSDNGREFDNTNIEEYCDEVGIKHEFSATYTPQQNGVVERKNRILITLARSMLDEYGTSEKFWAEAVFDCKCYIYKKRQHLGKFQRRCDIGFLLGYSSKSKAYRVFNNATGMVEETYDVEFDESNGSQGAHVDVVNVDEEPLVEAIKHTPIGDIKPKENEDEVQIIDQPSSSMASQDGSEQDKILPNEDVHVPQEQIDEQAQDVSTLVQAPQMDTANEDVGTSKKKATYNPTRGVTIRSRNTAAFIQAYSFVSSIEPTTIDQALSDPDWVNAMHEELNNFTRNEVWTLETKPKGARVIGTKWVFKNKQDDEGNIAIRFLLAYATYHDMKLYQMDVKSAYLNGYINELVYVKQPPGLETPTIQIICIGCPKPSMQAPRAWYERPRDFPIEKRFKIGRVDTTLFTKKTDNDLFVGQVSVDDIIFGSTNEEYCKEFGKMIAKEFEMSMIGELAFFLGFQIKQLKEGTFIYQEKYTRDLLKRFKMNDCKPIDTPMSTNTKLDIDESGIKVDQTLYRSMIGSLLYLCASRPDIMFSVCLCARFQADPKESHLSVVKRILRYLKHTPSIDLWYLKGASFELLGYSDLDFAGCRDEHKSTSGGCYLLGRSLVSWSSKKQNFIKQTLLDYGVKLSRVPLLCDNESAVKLTNNLVQHSRTKHIDIRHHFIRDHVAKGDIQLRNVGTKEQLADIFTKPLDESTFHRLRSELNMLDARMIM